MIPQQDKSKGFNLFKTQFINSPILPHIPDLLQAKSTESTALHQPVIQREKLKLMPIIICPFQEIPLKRPLDSLKKIIEKQCKCKCEEIFESLINQTETTFQHLYQLIMESTSVCFKDEHFSDAKHMVFFQDQRIFIDKKIIHELNRFFNAHVNQDLNYYKDEVLDQETDAILSHFQAFVYINQNKVIIKPNYHFIIVLHILQKIKSISFKYQSQKKFFYIYLQAFRMILNDTIILIGYEFLFDQTKENRFIKNVIVLWSQNIEKIEKSLVNYIFNCMKDINDTYLLKKLCKMNKEVNNLLNIN